MRYWIFLFVSSLIILVGGFVVSVFSGDGHFFNRAGATLTALCVFLALLEYQIDRDIDQANSSHENIKINRPSAESVIISAKFASWLSSRRRDRKTVLSASCLFGAAGEIIHGWGDLLFYAIWC